jgi:hypothetical protein
VSLVRVQVVETGETAWVTPEAAQAGEAAGKFRPVGKVLAETSTGEAYAVEAGADLAQRGLEQAESTDVAALAQAEADAEIAGGLGGAARAFYQGATDSLFLGASSALAGEEQRGEIARLRREQGAAYQGGRIVTDIATGVVGASKGAVGRAVSALPGGAVTRLSERLVAGGVAGSRALGAVGAGALEGAAGAAADYLADQALMEKPALSGEAFAASLGTGALLGGAIGGGLGGVGAAIERRAARRGASGLGRLADDAAGVAVDTERAAMAAVDELAAESDRIPLSSLIPPRAATPEGVAERVSGVYGALRQADAERIALQAEIDDAVLPGLDLLPNERAQAVRDELGAATRAYRTALDDAKGWARGLDKEQRAMTRARLDEERIREAAGRTAASLEREGIKTSEAEQVAAQRIERERIRTARVAEGPRRRAKAPLADVIPAEQPGNKLLQQLQRTQERVTGGAKLGDVSEEAAAAVPHKVRRGRQPKMPDGFDVGPHIAPDARRIKGIPELPDLDEDALYVVRAADLRAQGNVGLKEGVDEGRKASIQRGWSEGKKFDPIDVTIRADGSVEIAQGRHRLWAAAEEGRDIPVRFSRGIEEPKVGGKDAVAEFLAKYKRKDQRFVSSLTGDRAGFRPGAVDRLVTPQGPADEVLPAPLRLDEFRRAEPGEPAELLARERARDTDLDRLLLDLRREGHQADDVVRAAAKAGESATAAAESADEALSPGAAQVGRILDGDSDDALDVFARLDEAAEQMRRAVARARQAPAGAGAAATVSLPDAPAAAGGPGIVRRIAGVAQNVGSAMEVASALGVPVPSAAGIPVIGPALSSYLKLRAAWRTLRGSGASLPATPAARAAAARVRIEAAARASVTRVLQIGTKALTSSTLPGIAGRQAGRLADSVRDREAEQREMRDEINAVMAANPATAQTEIARAAVGAPMEVTTAAQESAARAVSYLQSVAPRAPGQGTPWASEPRYTATQMAQWKQRHTAVQQPQETASALALGIAAPWAKEALVQVWPEIWGLWREEITRQQDVLAKLARPQRMAIGSAFDVPLDLSQFPGYPRAGATPAQAPQASPAMPTRAPQPSVKPRAAEIYATPEQDAGLGLQ